MCGLIANFPKEFNTNSDVALRLGLARMQARGPDSEGIWQAEDAILGHRRLAILDLDERAAQPMFSPCGRYVMVFNGEIYNYRALKAELQASGVLFKTESDSEVILALFAREGEGMLPKLRGMFALVIWDTQDKRGFAARDPYGIKPLYYAQTSDGLWFASQVKALLATQQVSSKADVIGQSSFWFFGSVAEPDTWYEHIKCLPAGHYVWISEGSLEKSPCAYWNIAEDFRTSPTEIYSSEHVQAEVRAAMQESVSAHLVSDVPVAVFLSGGIDSGSLAGLMVEAGAKNLHGITVGFREFEGKHENEVPVAAELAARYGIQHHIRWVSKQEFLADLPLILDAMDQPSIDGVNTWFASKAVAELGLKVVVSGVGGDELFQGYSNFTSVPKLVSGTRLAAKMPGGMHLMQWLCDWQSRRSGNARWRYTPSFARSIQGAWHLSRSMHSPDEVKELLQNPIFGEFNPKQFVTERMGNVSENPALAVSQMESCFYMRNQLLRDSDWASMAHSVELRTPLVDAHMLRKLSPYLHEFQKFPNKSLLSGSVRPLLPNTILQRSKTGFGVPMGRWLSEQSQSSSGGLASKAWSMQIVSSFNAEVG